MIPKAETFNLLGDSDKTKKKASIPKPVSHFKTKIYMTVLTEIFEMSQVDIPPELARLIRVSYKMEFLPIIQNDFLKTRLRDLEEITINSTKIPLEFQYNPIGVGKLRLLMHVEHALGSLQKIGFSKKDVDEVKGIFSDTNVYLLCGTVFIGSIHVSIDKLLCTILNGLIGSEHY